MKRSITSLIATCCAVALCQAATATARPQEQCQSKATAAKTVAVQDCPSTCAEPAGTVAQVSQIECCLEADGGTPSAKAMKALQAALIEMKKAGCSDCSASGHVHAALAALSKAEPQTIMVSFGDGADCDLTNAKVISLAGSGECSSGGVVKIVAAASPTECATTCDSTKAVAIASPTECSSSKSVAMSTCVEAPAKLAGSSDCSSSSSSCSSAAPAAKVVSVSDCASSCSSAAPAAKVVSASDCASSCSSTKAAQVALATTSDCSSSSSSCSSAAPAAKVVSTSDCASSCGSATEARFVAFDCGTCDRVVRAAAEAYLRILMETKSATGVDGCPMDVARKALAAVIEDMQTRVASESGEVRNVSLGAVAESDCSKASSESCSKK